ncbi:hypothetical protein DM860_004379 [Cuscuta australis]|uniref:Uncharacterized protein n=1 Tax=Cuscuta australis TaxID=267555 RepID=A0A328EB49_9ASTE|nr:hypothetical protein DM860_004379 [Cuscuta australis]
MGRFYLHTGFKVGSAFVRELESHVAINSDNGRPTEDAAQARLPERPEGSTASLAGWEGPKGGNRRPTRQELDDCGDKSGPARRGPLGFLHQTPHQRRRHHSPHPTTLRHPRIDSQATWCGNYYYNAGI